MTTQPTRLLGALSNEAFLQEYWQKRPLLVRNALPQARSLIQPTELAGLALEEDIESRILVEHSPVHWELRHGPFTKTSFQKLPHSHWTLLVQAVDQVVPEISQLLSLFDFIPNWRIDDVMVSYAVSDGSVGPHFDHYDVFLVQGEGQRRWRIGQLCDETTELLPDAPMRILNEFDARHEWVLNPGDMLYLPPEIAHHGVAISNCITYSIGFRAPSQMEILNDFAHYLAEFQTEHQRYRDPDLVLQPNPGWISPDAIDKVHKQLMKTIGNPSHISQWFARYLSQTKYDINPVQPDSAYSNQEVLDYLTDGLALNREESSRFVYLGSALQPTDFYINGAPVGFEPAAANLVLHLCKYRRYSPDQLLRLSATAANLTLITELVNLGFLYFDEDAGD